MTHHLPAMGCVHERYRGDPLNCYFVSDLEPLIRERNPAPWMHGHTHQCVDITVGSTRVVCNPFGYARMEENAGFKEKCVIDLPHG